MSNSAPWFVPDWPAPENVRSLVTTRHGGVSQGAYSSLNLGAHVGDDPYAVARNRGRVSAEAGAQPVWLNQVHGTRGSLMPPLQGDRLPEADAAFSRQRRLPCAVMTADCLPVLFCDDAGTVVAAAHAGWRGLLAGVLEATVGAMGRIGCGPPGLPWAGHRAAVL